MENYNKPVICVEEAVAIIKEHLDKIEARLRGLGKVDMEMAMEAKVASVIVLKGKLVDVEKMRYFL